jgi:hypothetical protein
LELDTLPEHDDTSALLEQHDTKMEHHEIVTFNSRASVKQLKKSGNVSKLLERLNQPNNDN